MTLDIYWRLPTHGDPSNLGRRSPARGDWGPLVAGNVAPGLINGESDGSSYVDHLAEIAKAAEVSGFYGGLIPSFPMTDDPWVISGALARETKAFNFMVAFQPAFLHPLQAARMSASLQQLSGGRLVYNIITGGGGPSQLWWGDDTGHDDRYARTTEFLDVLRGVWSSQPFDHQGRFYSVAGAALPQILAREAVPEIYFSGSSDAALLSASKHADYYLSWLEPFAQLKTKFASVKARTEGLGRQIKCAVRVDVCARPTEAAAWAELRKAYDNIQAEDLGHHRTVRGRGDSVGAGRQTSLGDPSRFEDLIIGPTLWAGFHLLRGGPALGIVGSYAQVAERLDELVDLGVDAFILAAVPHLEEAYRVGEEVLPLMSGRRTPARLAAE